MNAFSGSEADNWDAFILQFRRLAKDRRWKEKKKLSNLYRCLTGAASLYANRLNCTTYKALRKELKNRFSKAEEPTTARKKLKQIKQNEGETLEEFSQRVYFICLDAFKYDPLQTLEANAAEYFLEGCREKAAALKAMDAKPQSLHKALKLVKEAKASIEAIFGNQAATLKVRQLGLNESEDESEIPDVRLARPQGGRGRGYRNRSKSPQPQVRNFSTGSADKQTPREEFESMRKKVSELTEQLAKVGKRVSFDNTSTRSKSPEATCFRCHKKGHFVRDCPDPPSRDPSPGNIKSALKEASN